MELSAEQYARLERGPSGRAPLFPSCDDPTRPARKEIAGCRLATAERLAKVPQLARGQLHPYQRLWASERRHLSARDVAAAGGWRSLAVMRAAYQHTDEAGVRSVVENRPAPAKRDSRATKRADARG